MLKLVIVDDQNSALGILQSIFTNVLYISLIGFASNGQEAIQMVREYSPDIVLMDIRMPIMDGIEATKIISEQFDKTKVILFTSQDDLETRNLAIKAGANGFVTKINDLENLDQVVDLVSQGFEYFQFREVSGKLSQLPLNFKKDL